MAQKPQAADPVRSAREYFGWRLRHWRSAAGLTQAELGELVGYDHSYISKVESGRRWPAPELPARCDELLGAGQELAALWPLIEDERQRAMAREVPAGPVIRSPVEAPVLDPFTLVVPSLRVAAAEPRAVGRETVDGLATLLTAYERFDGDLGGSAIVDAVESQLRLMMGWMATVGRAVRSPLFVVAARYANLAGWTRFEKGQHGLAMAWFDRALGWAGAGGEPGLAGDIQTRMGVIARAEGDQGRALACARAASTGAAGRPWIGFLVAVLEARATAALGDQATCEQRLGRAQDLMGRTDPADASWLVGPEGAAMLASARAACFRDLAARSGRRALALRAVDSARQALEVNPGRMLPNQALFVARLADTYACAADPDAAVAVVEPVLTLPDSVRSALVLRELRSLSRRLDSRWRQIAMVRELAERVRALEPRA